MNCANRMTAVGGSSQTYDNAGNLTHTAAIYSSTAYTLIYDHHNRLAEVKDNAGTTRKAKFTWDALGRRIEYIDDTNSTTTRYYYDGVSPLDMKRPCQPVAKGRMNSENPHSRREKHSRGRL